MRNVSLGLALLFAFTNAPAQDMRPGIASIAQISAEAEGRYEMDGHVVNARKLKRTLVALDEQLPIGYVHLRGGSAGISPGQLAEIQGLAVEIGAQLLVEVDGKLQPVSASTPPTGSGD